MQVVSYIRLISLAAGVGRTPFTHGESRYCEQVTFLRNEVMNTRRPATNIDTAINYLWSDVYDSFKEIVNDRVIGALADRLERAETRMCVPGDWLDHGPIVRGLASLRRTATEQLSRVPSKALNKLRTDLDLQVIVHVSLDVERGIEEENYSRKG